MTDRINNTVMLKINEAPTGHMRLVRKKGSRHLPVLQQEWAFQYKDTTEFKYEWRDIPIVEKSNE